MSTHQPLLYHIVFSTKHRQPWLTDGFREDLFGYVNDTSGKIRKFGWQDGFGAFTVSMSQQSGIVDDIDRQRERHAGWSFQDEYLSRLEKHEVEYDPRYLWDWSHRPGNSLGVEDVSALRA